MNQAPIRVMIAKLGLDGHDRGAKVVARTLRDAGMEVIYTGLHKTPEEVVTAAMQEDVSVLGVSLLSGAHMTLIPRVIALLKAADADDIPLVVGGVFPDEDIPEMKALGVAHVLPQDTPPDEIIRTIQTVAASRYVRAGAK
jgi:methylmalonyl-CoA mutase C-terminal domain/subunit